MRKIIVVSLFLIFIWFISDHNSVFAVQINCRGQIGDRGSGQQAADDSGCATALSCPEELRIAGKCGNLNEVENSSILSKFCSTFDFVENSSLCRWAGGGEDLSIPSELINQRESKSQEVAQSSGTRVISQANTFSITDKIVGWFISDRDTGALNKYLPYQVQQNTDDSSSPLTTHNLVAGCGEGKGSAAVPYELCNKIAYSPGEDNNGDGGIPDGNYPLPTPTSEGLVYFSQYDPAYSKHKLPIANEAGYQCDIEYAGCGPTTTSMILCSYGSKCYAPPDVVDIFYQGKAGCNGSDANDAMAILAQDPKIETNGWVGFNESNYKKVFKGYTDTGWDLFAVADFYRGQDDFDKEIWTGHLFWITDVDANGEIYTMDPAYGTGKPIPMSQKSLRVNYRGAFLFKRVSSQGPSDVQ